MIKTIVNKIKSIPLPRSIGMPSADEREHRLVVMNLSFIFALLIFSGFTIINALRGHLLIAFIDFLFIIPSSFGLYLLRKNYDIDKLAIFTTIMLFMASLIIVTVQSGAEYTLMWTVVFAFAVMALNGAKKGLYFSMLYYPIVFLIAYSYIGDAITTTGYVRFVAVSIVMIALAYFYEKTTQNAFDMLSYSINEVEYLNKNLESKIEEKTHEQSLLLSLFDKGDTVLFKWNHDVNWSINDVSLSVKALTGYSKDEIILGNIDYASLVHQDDIQRVRSEVSKVEESNVEFFKHEPYRVVTKSGDVKWVLDYTIVVRDENDNITHFIGAISDITELKQQEKLIQEQSRLAQMGEMISMIAHQWRQPLGAISTTAVNLQMKIELEEFDTDTKEGRAESDKYFLERLENINGFVHNLTTTIDDFRNFYKPNKKSALVRLDEIILKALNIIKASLQNDHIEIIEQYNSKEEVEIYHGEMMQVILNMLKNSQDNFREKNIENPYIKIITENRTISICDNGGGIPEEIMDKIYDPYFSTKSELNGSGLGLYMSKIIVQEHHNGKLNAINQDEGICFTIEL